MSRTTKTIALHLFLALFFAGLVGAIGCGGGAGKKDDDPPDPPASYDMSGRVIDNDGQPIADAFVTARMGDGSGGVIDTAISAGDGSYAVTIPEATPFYLHVEKAGHADSNSHIRELTVNRTGIDVVLLFQVQADSLLSILGGPAALTPANVLFLVRALDPSGAELPDVFVNVTPVGLLVQYRLADNSGYSMAGPTVACTLGGGCSLPQTAGQAGSVNQGVSIFRLSTAAAGTLANVAAPLLPGEVTFVVND